MLILTRRAGETLLIGNDVIITVQGIKGNQVRLGIDAPKGVRVHRGETQQRNSQPGTTPEPETPDAPAGDAAGEGTPE